MRVRARVCACRACVVCMKIFSINPNMWSIGQPHPPPLQPPTCHGRATRKRGRVAQAKEILPAGSVGPFSCGILRCKTVQGKDLANEICRLFSWRGALCDKFLYKEEIVEGEVRNFIKELSLVFDPDLDEEDVRRTKQAVHNWLLEKEFSMTEEPPVYLGADAARAAGAGADERDCAFEGGAGVAAD